MKRGELMATAIIGGFKIAWRRQFAELGAAGLDILQIFGGQQGSLGGATYGATQNQPVNIGTMARQAASENMITEIRTLKNELSMMAETLRVQTGPGGTFRFAQPGETSSLVDQEGRMIILLESIDRKLNPTPFPAR